MVNKSEENIPLGHNVYKYKLSLLLNAIKLKTVKLFSFIISCIVQQ